MKPNTQFYHKLNKSLNKTNVESKLILLVVSAWISEYMPRFISQLSAKRIRGGKRKEKDKTSSPTCSFNPGAWKNG